MGVNHIVDPAWCSGCGLHHHVIGEHRDDCTLPEEIAKREERKA